MSKAHVWQLGPVTLDAATAGELFRLDVPAAGEIKSVRMGNTNTGASCDIQLYSSDLAAMLITPALQARDTTISADLLPFMKEDTVADAVNNALPLSMYTIGTSQSAAAGSLNANVSWPYVNSDSSPTNAVQRIWVHVQNNTAAGGSPWFLTMDIIPSSKS